MQVILSFLVPLFVWLASSLIQRILVGAGLTLVVGAGFDALISHSLDAAKASLSSGNASALAFAQLLGVGSFLSIVGTALVLRAYISLTSGMITGIKKV
jgi:hypothetical protein